VSNQTETQESAGAKLAKALSNPWRARIIGEVYQRPMSPSQFVEEIGGEISTISRHFRWLANMGYIEVIDEKSGGRRRGGVEHIYQGTQRARLLDPEWETMPLEVRELWSRNAVAVYYRRIIEAMDARTFDAEEDRHFSWDSVALDRQGWNELVARLLQVLDWLPELETESAQRLEKSGEDPIAATVGLAGFRSPGESDPKMTRSESEKAEQ
jgi:DNA-binding transcriptional ArsR family regulator